MLATCRASMEDKVKCCPVTCDPRQNIVQHATASCMCERLCSHQANVPADIILQCYWKRTVTLMADEPGRVQLLSVRACTSRPFVSRKQPWHHAQREVRLSGTNTTSFRLSLINDHAAVRKFDLPCHESAMIWLQVL